MNCSLNNNAMAAIPTPEPEYYVFIVTDVEWEPFTKGDTIARTLAKTNLWLASQATPYRSAYRSGDRVLFYVAGPKARYFIGKAVIAEPISDATKEDHALAAELGLDGFEERLPLTDVVLWERPVPIKPQVDRLTFIKDKKNYGLNLRQAAARIPASDYELIVQEASKEASHSSGGVR